MISGCVGRFSGGTASSETPPPSIRQGVRIVPPDSSFTVEEVLLAVGEHPSMPMVPQWLNLAFGVKRARGVLLAFEKMEAQVR